MTTCSADREFQLLVKPAGAHCTLRCAYCYFLPHATRKFRKMPDELLQTYILQHIEACTDPVITFAWHGGEPTLSGLDVFRGITDFQKRHCPEGRSIVNGIQTNGLELNASWCRFLAEERFIVGLSLDGAADIHDRYRVTPRGEPTHARVMRTFDLLREHEVVTECLCVVHSESTRHRLEVYDFFRDLGVSYLTFLPLVEPVPEGGASQRSVQPDEWGAFLCAIFDRWRDHDIGRIKIQLFDEVVRPAFGLKHTLCVFRETCNVPILDWNGDVYSCDHFVTPDHLLGNIRETPLSLLLDSPRHRAFGRAKQETLPDYCLRCPVLDMCNGGCPKDRFIRNPDGLNPDGRPGLNYLCSGYRRFFTHCMPFVAALSDIRRHQE
jgi:uncharacterized protein